MSMIDIKNLEHLTPEQKKQYSELLENFPHLNSKMDSSRNLDTPLANEIRASSNSTDEIDYDLYTNINSEINPNKRSVPVDSPEIKIDEKSNFFSSFEPEVAESTNKMKAEVEKKRIQSAIKSGQPEAVAKFNPEGKVHPILKKMRATLGMRVGHDERTLDLGGCKYSMRVLDRARLTQATVLAISMTSNPDIYESNLETAIVAFSIVSIDKVPTADIFSIPYEDSDSKTLTSLQRNERAAHALYIELLSSPNELVENLSIFYQQEFPNLNLLGAGRSRYLCPMPNCLQSRIAEVNGDCFCPVHGEKMAAEDALPNPL